MFNKRFFLNFWELLRDSFFEFLRHRVMKLSAALAYYTIFSIAPMLVVIISLGDIFYGKEALQGTVFSQIQSFVGPESALQIQKFIKNIRLSGGSEIATIIGVITLFIGATGVFSEIQDSINLIWGLKVKPEKSWIKLLLNRLISFSMVVSLGFILLVTLIINGVLSIISDKLIQFLPELAVYLTYWINSGLIFIVTTLLFAIIFKVLPDARIHWKDVLVGSVFTTLLFLIGKYVIGLYLGKSSVLSVYGTAGSVILILLWVNYSAIILYYGAEFTHTYARRFGRKISPNQYAEWSEEEVAFRDKEKLMSKTS